MKDTATETVCWYGREFRFPFHGLLRALTTEEYADLKEAIQRDGKVHKPVVTDGADAIFDGENRLRIAQELKLPQNAVQFDPRGRGLSPAAAEQLARDLNDTGRQDPMALRKANRAARIERVVEAREAGDSLRTIAEKEGVSQPQILRDLAAAASGDTPPVSPEQTLENPAENNAPQTGKKKRTVKGKDGKTYPAKPRKPPKPKPPKACERCERIGSPCCKKCKEKFPNGFTPPEPERDPGGDDGELDAAQDISDAIGRKVPNQAVEAFRAVTVLEGLGRECDRLRQLIGEAIKGPAGRLLQTALPGIEQKLKDIKGMLMANRPSHVCPYCKGEKNGKPCECCKGEGWTARHVWNAAPGDKK